MNTAMHTSTPQGRTGAAPRGHSTSPTEGKKIVNPRGNSPAASETQGSLPEEGSGTGSAAPGVARGISERMATLRLRDAIWRRALALADRFRLIRTIDLAAACCPERPYKASVVAAQRAMRGMVKARLLTRFRTDRFQTVYGLTARGAEWLQEAGLDGSSSVRRVADMRNPEHRLWIGFIVIACEARGLRSLTESEVLRVLNKSTGPGKDMVQGLLSVAWASAGKTSRQNLRPDAIAYESDGATWFEIDISKRGSGREAALSALASSVGRQLPLGIPLRRVVVYCKTERIRKRALALLRSAAKEQNSRVLVGERTHLREVEDGIFEVWRAVEQDLPDGRTRCIDKQMGHVIVQPLPIWLPKLRVEDGGAPITGWFSDGLLPYQRPATLECWPALASPLLRPSTLVKP